LRFEVQTLAIRNEVMKQPVSHKASVLQGTTQPKKRNAAMSSVPDNDFKVEHGEDVSQEKLSCTSEDLKVQYALRLKGKDSKLVSSHKKGDVSSHAIVVDGSGSDSDSCNSDKSQNDHVEKMADLSKKAGRSLPSCTVGASNGNAEVNVGKSEGSSETAVGACSRCQTLLDRAEEYFVQQQANFPDDKIPFLTDVHKMGYYLQKKEYPFLHNFEEQHKKFKKINYTRLDCSNVF